MVVGRSYGFPLLIVFLVAVVEQVVLHHSGVVDRLHLSPYLSVVVLVQEVAVVVALVPEVVGDLVVLPSSSVAVDYSPVLASSVVEHVVAVQ